MINATTRPLYPRERPGAHCIGGWVGPRAVLDGCEKSRSHTGIRSPNRLTRNKSLYRLSYPGHKSTSYIRINCFLHRKYGVQSLQTPTGKYGVDNSRLVTVSVVKNTQMDCANIKPTLIFNPGGIRSKHWDLRSGNIF